MLLFASLIFKSLVFIVYGSANMTSREVTMQFLSDQQSLYSRLFENYNKQLAPVYTKKYSPFLEEDEPSGEHFAVNIELSYLKLIQFEEPKEKVSFLMDYILTWNDYRLVWNPRDFGGIDHMYLTIADLWIPEVVPVSGHDVQDFREDFQKYGWVNFNGSAGMYFSVLISSVCSPDVNQFPFDQQTCALSFLSHSFLTYEQLVTSTISEPFPLSIDMMGTGEWQVLNLSSDVQIINPDDLYEIQIQRFNISLKRNPIFYMMLIVIPSFVLNIFSIFGIFMKSSDLMAKLTVGLTNIMSLTFILGILSGMIPKTRKLPILAIYILINLVIIISSIVIAAVLPYTTERWKKCIHSNRPESDKEHPHPLWLRIFTLNRLITAIMQLANIINLIAFLV